MMWTCELCNYETSYSSNYYKHLRTSAHISLFNNKKKVSENRKKNKLKNEILFYNKLNFINKNVKTIKYEQIKTNEYVKIISDEQNKISDNIKIIKEEQIKTNNGVKKLTDYVKFLNIHCKDAEPLNLLTDKEIEEILDLDNYNENEFEEMLIKYYKSKNLYIKIGELILKKYLKPNDPRQQRIWTSDISRLIYLILQMVGDQKNWVRDKKGVIFTELITRPIITKIIKIMSEYGRKILTKFDVKDEDYIENSIILDNVQIAENISSKFYCEQLEKDVIKFTASKFSVAIKKEEIMEC